MAITHNTIKVNIHTNNQIQQPKTHQSNAKTQILSNKPALRKPNSNKLKPEQQLLKHPTNSKLTKHQIPQKQITNPKQK